MRILFVGNEEEYAKATLKGENSSLFSLFLSEKTVDNDVFDAVIIPALRFLSLPSACKHTNVIASGSGTVTNQCFSAGCSDFIREPWTEEELHARVLSRTSTRISFGNDRVILEGCHIDGPEGSAWISLETSRIIALLVANAGQPVLREAIQALINTPLRSGRSIDMRIARIRSVLRKIGTSDLADSLRCVRGAYHFFIEKRIY